MSRSIPISPPPASAGTEVVVADDDVESALVEQARQPLAQQGDHRRNEQHDSFINAVTHELKTPISLVRLLDRLVEHGLLERRPDPRDRRANRLFLTPGGRQLVDDLDSLRDSIATDVLQDIPAAAIETGLETLQHIKERIKNFAEPPGSVAAK